MYVIICGRYYINFSLSLSLSLSLIATPGRRRKGSVGSALTPDPVRKTLSPHIDQTPSDTSISTSRHVEDTSSKSNYTMYNVIIMYYDLSLLATDVVVNLRLHFRLLTV